MAENKWLLICQCMRNPLGSYSFANITKDQTLVMLLDDQKYLHGTVCEFLLSQLSCIYRAL